MLHKKGFDPRWTSWMMQFVRGGNSVININDKVDSSLGMLGEYDKVAVISSPI